VSGLVVNYASGGFVRGQERLLRSCQTINQDVACYGAQDGLTDHSQVPYYFKIDALTRASRLCRLLLWLDSSIVATGRPLDPIFEHVRREGYLLTWQGWDNAQWCNDRSLASFGYTRDQAKLQKQVRGGFYGLNLDHPTGRLILEELVAHRDDFCGQWSNRHLTESADPRCLGHRHDQSILSLIAARHSLFIMDHDAEPWCCYDQNPSYLLNILGIP